MPLRALTTGLAILGLGLVFGLPFQFRGPGEGAPMVELKSHALRLAGYVVLTVAVWVAVAIGALLIVVRERRELAERERDMVRGLVEGSLGDHVPRD